MDDREYAVEEKDDGVFDERESESVDELKRKETFEVLKDRIRGQRHKVLAEAIVYLGEVDDVWRPREYKCKDHGVIVPLSRH